MTQIFKYNNFVMNVIHIFIKNMGLTGEIVVPT